jgi:hypothetical protein
MCALCVDFDIGVDLNKKLMSYAMDNVTADLYRNLVKPRL